MQVHLSVIVLTYNHRNFVSAALNSIRAQETDFDFEVIIADDASTDGTSELVISHLAHWEGFRGKPLCLFREKNMGMQRNAMDAIGRARGKYIAFLEGDDYWIDPQKLRLQVRFLDANPDHFLCAHKTMIRKGDEIREHEWRLNRFREAYSVQDYLGRLFFHTSSMVLRSRRGFPEWLESIKQFDQGIVLLSSASGSDRIRVLPRNMSVYRMHPGGVTQSLAHRDLRRAQWSYLRLLCGIVRDCRWIDRKHLRRKMKETLVHTTLHFETSNLRRLRLILCHLPIFCRLVVYKIRS